MQTKFTSYHLEVQLYFLTKNIDLYLPIIKYISTSTTTSDCPVVDPKSMLRYGTVEQTKQRPPLSLRPEAVSQRFRAPSTKSDSRVDTSCQQSTHSRGGKNTKPSQSASEPPSDQTHHPQGSSRSKSLPVCFLPKEGRRGLRKDGGFPLTGQREQRTLDGTGLPLDGSVRLGRSSVS